MENMDLKYQVSTTIEDEEILNSSNQEVDQPSSSSSGHFEVFAQNRMTRLEEGSYEHDMIKASFLMGVGIFAEDTTVVTIHKNSHSDFIGLAQQESFRIFSEAVANKDGGNANVNFAWHAASKDEICEIVAHGFSKCRLPETNGLSHGLGVHLSPLRFAMDGVLSSIADEHSLRHLLLCRVILGNMEVIFPGSKQFLPSSKHFDSRVDDLSTPRIYITWAAYMNSYILPSYIVSFRAPCCFTGDENNQSPTSRSSPPQIRPHITFSTLHSTLSTFLPRRMMVLIDKYYNEYREGRLPPIILIQHLMQLAGVKLLKAILKFYRGKQSNAPRTLS